METTQTVRMWVEFFRTKLAANRSERGGVTDDLAMIGLIAGAAVTVGGVIVALVTGKVNDIKVGW
jgi:hypothetical protein